MLHPTTQKQKIESKGKSPMLLREERYINGQIKDDT